MGSHPINLALRFILELAALFSVGLWGWKQSDGFLKFVLAIGIPVVVATVWGVFAVPDDPSRSGAAPIPTPGIIRLFIEMFIFAFASWALLNSGYKVQGWVFIVIITLHYLFSYDRILWLLKH